MLYIYTLEDYSAINKDEFMKFSGKWMELENIMLSDVTQTKKNTWYALTDKWILSQRPIIPMIKLTDYMKLNRG